MAWPVRLDEPAALNVWVVYDAPSTSVGSRFYVRFASQELTGIVRAGQNLSLPLGRVELPRGSFVLKVVPESIQGDELMRLRAVLLAPVR